MANSKISIIIPSRNVRDDMKKCLNALVETCQRDGLEVIVTDSNSTDGTVEMLAEDFPWVIVNRCKEVGSYASSINRGLKEASGDYILFLDSDVIINEHVIPGLVDFMESNPDVGATVSKLCYPDGSLQMSTRKFPTPVSFAFGRETFLTRFFPNNPITKDYLMLDKLAQNEPYEIDWAASACMMVRREVVKTGCFFDEGYPFYWADADYCHYLHDKGWKIYCVADLSVIHDMRNDDSKKRSTFAIKAFHKGIYRYFKKHHTKSKLNPLNLIAFLVLGLRASILLLLNSFKPDGEVG